MAGKYLKVYYNMTPAIEKLSDAEAGRLIKGALKYGSLGEPPVFSGSERFIWPLFMEQIDEESENHMKRCLINKENAKKKANRNESDQIAPNRTESLSRKESSKEKNINNNNPTRRFIPPTVEEVEAYCRERNNDIDAQHFVDYYASNGWRVGKNPMKDWKATVRNWERNDSVKPKPNAAEVETNNPFLKLILEGKVTDD